MCAESFMTKGALLATHQPAGKKEKIEGGWLKGVLTTVGTRIYAKLKIMRPDI